jgi:replicative DNA helicase
MIDKNFPPILTDKIPPQNIEAEKCVLGSMLIEQDTISKVIEIIDENSFYKEIHRKIFKAIISLFERNEAVDLITVTEELAKKENIDLIEVHNYLEELIDSVPTAANAEYYARIVKEKAVLRSLINISTQIIHDAHEEVENIDELLDKAQQMIFDISQKKETKGITKIKDYIHPTIEGIETMYHTKTKTIGLPTGFVGIDELTSGLQKSDLIIVAGRPGMGKTSFCFCIALHAAIVVKKPVIIFSLEMPNEQVSMRMLSILSRIEMGRLRTGKIYENEWPTLASSAGIIADAPIYLDDTVPLTVLDIRAKMRRFISEKKEEVGLIVIDYLQMMHTKTKAENRQQEVAEISRSLKTLAKELNVPVMVISQLSRAPEVRSRENPRPQLSDLRESGAIEQDSDLVMFIYRPGYYEKDIESNEAEIIIAKHRNGPTGVVKLAFIKEYTRFENLISTPEIS